MIFSKEEKAAAFDRISECFYKQNFGRMSKSDIELLMFDIYMKKIIEKTIRPDGTIDYSKSSDYSISRELGITQQKIRSLKIKDQLSYPVNYEWEKALARLTENARYDREKKSVIINIPDPNLYLDIQNFIETNGAYIEKHLNSKVLELRVEYFIDLILHLEPEEKRKSIIKSLKKSFKESGKEDSSFDEKNIGKSLIKWTGDLTSIAANISSIISPGNVIGNALVKLIQRQ